MSLDLAASYDALPYEGKPQPPTHPDNMATVAWLMGLIPPSVERCRVLELGCGDGGNLIPMAATLPHSEFVGLDLSPRQIADGNVMTAALGLKNIRLEALSILDVDDSLGVFDYILCHGVYSWVPAPVQDKILEICSRNLSPTGIAYISYNTYPGWYLRGAARDLMIYHTRRFHDPAEKVRQARAILAYLVEALPQPDSLYRRVLQEEAELLREQRDSYVFHEHLELTNSAHYFHDFVRHAGAKALQFLGEAAYHANLNEFTPDLRTTLQALAPERIQREQYLDFVTNRMFRRTLLCHADLPVQTKPASEQIMSCGLTALAKPEGETVDVVSREATVEFRTEEGFSATTNVPLIKAALLSVYEEWPRCLPFDELWQRVSAKLPEAPGEEQRPALAEALLQCWLTNVIEIHRTQAPLCLTLGDKPKAFSVARFQARAGVPRVANVRHRTVQLDALDRQLVLLMDGTRDVATLRRELGEVENFDERLHNLVRNSLLSS